MVPSPDLRAYRQSGFATRALRIGAQLLQSALFCTACVNEEEQLKAESNKSCAMKEFGGRGRDRIGDPVLAKLARTKNQQLSWSQRNVTRRS
jgi:hypothetical protein